MSNDQSFKLELIHMVYILGLIIPMAVTWGIYTTKMQNLTEKVIEVRTENIDIKKHDIKMRELVHSIELEVATNKSDINNLKARLLAIIANQTPKHTSRSDYETNAKK